MARGRILRYFGLVGAAYAISTIGTGLADYLTRFDFGKTVNLAISGGIGLLTAMSLGAVDLAKQGKEDETPRYQPAPGGYPSHPGGPGRAAGGKQPARSAAGAGLVLGVVLLIALCGGVAYALTSGVQWAVDRISVAATPPWLQKTKDPGTQRLAEQVSQTEKTLTLTVLSVRVNKEVTMVDVHARNAGSESLALPVYRNAQLTIPGQTLQADPAASDSTWPGEVPAGGEMSGTVVFDGPLPPGPAEIKLVINRIYSLGFDAPDSISVAIQVT